MQQRSENVYRQAVIWSLITFNAILVKQLLVMAGLTRPSLVLAFIPLVFASVKYGRRVGMACAGVIMGSAVAFRQDIWVSIEVGLSAVFIAMMVGEMRHKARLEPTLLWVLNRIELIVGQFDVVFQQWGYTSEQIRLKQIGNVRDRLADLVLSVRNRIAIIQSDAMWYRKIEEEHEKEK